jgi:hypothetical protein
MERFRFPFGMWVRSAMLAAVLIAAAEARADPTPISVSAAAMADGRARFEEGLKLAEQGQHDAARLKFSQAWSVLRAPAVLYNLARAEQLSGHLIDALHHFREFAKMTDPKIDDRQRQAAADNISEISKRVSQIDIEAPPHARVSIDGRPVESDLDDPVAVLPGTHVVEAIAGGKVKRVTVDCQAGLVAKAKLAEDASAPAANHNPAPAPSQRPADSTPPPSSSRGAAGWAVPIGLGAFGVIGLATGVGFAAASQSSKEEAETLRRSNPGLCANPPSAACAIYDEKRSSAQSQATVAWIGYAAGGIFLAGAIALWVLWPTDEKTSSTARSVRVTPALGPRMGGAALHVSF